MHEAATACFCGSAATETRASSDIDDLTGVSPPQLSVHSDTTNTEGDGAQVAAATHATGSTIESAPLKVSVEQVKHTHSACVGSNPGGGKQVNQYTKIRTLSKGRRGEKVTLYRDEEIGELCALKSAPRATTWKLHLAGQEEAAATAALREAAVLQQLHHPHIVRLLEVIDDPSQPKVFLVLEYLAGGPIYEPANERDGPPAHTLSIEHIRTCMEHLLLGLRYLHSAGFAHLDIKPSNLQCAEDGSVKLIDFGLAVGVPPSSSVTSPRPSPQHAAGGLPSTSAADDEAASAGCSASAQAYPPDNAKQKQQQQQKQHTRRTPGTPAFTAPECAAGRQFNAQKADVWAAGVTLHLMLLLSYPFNPGSTLLETYKRIQSGNVRVPPNMASQQHGDLLAKLLRRDFHKRLSAAEALRHPFFKTSEADRRVSMASDRSSFSSGPSPSKRG